MNYAEQGSGELLVLLHGALTDQRMWRKVQEELSANYRVISLTQSHFFGCETDDHADFGYEYHAKELLKFCDLLGTKSHLIAWSYGADVALLAESIRPGSFRSLFVYECGRYTHLSERRLTEYFADAAKMFNQELFTPDMDDATKVAVLINASAGDDEYFFKQSEGQKAIQIQNAHTIGRQLSQSPSKELSCRDISEIAIPLMFSRGSRTRSLFRISTDSAHQCNARSKLFIVEGANHMLPIEDPIRFSEMVLAFVRGH